MTATETKTIQPRPAIQAMPSYHPPLASRDLLRLDFNENTFEPSPAVLATLKTITADQLTRYPEREPAEQIVAQHFGLQPNQVLLSNGVDEAIHTLCLTFLDETDEALIWTPGFFMYDVSIGLMTSTGIRRVQSGPRPPFPLRALPRRHHPPHQNHLHRHPQQPHRRRRPPRPAPRPRRRRSPRRPRRR